MGRMLERWTPLLDAEGAPDDLTATLIPLLATEITEEDLDHLLHLCRDADTSLNRGTALLGRLALCSVVLAGELAQAQASLTAYSN